MTKLDIECPNCRRDLTIEDLPEPVLERITEHAAREAYEDGASSKEKEFEDYVDAAEFISGERLFYELAAAIRRGDTPEAKLLLDRIAETIGLAAQNEVDLGWFSPRAKAAA